MRWIPTFRHPSRWVCACSVWKKWERGRDFRIGFEYEFWVVVVVFVVVFVVVV